MKLFQTLRATVGSPGTGFLFILALALFCALISSACNATQQTPVTLHVDASDIRRELPDRSIFGQNLSFANSANGAWDSGRHAFKQPFWDRFSAINPGLLRFPGGNWSHGYHFNLAREGIKHRVNTGLLTPHYRPQDFLKTIHQLPDARALIHLSPIWSSPQESAAFVAYMIGETTDSSNIGPDSWSRIDPRSKKIIDWHSVGYWARLRESDGQKAYQGTLYFQLGNEEWFSWCKDRVCEGSVDYYARHRPSRQVTVEDQGLKDPVSGVEVEAYWPNYRATYLSIRNLFTADQVRVGALLHAKPDGIAGADTFFRTAGGKGKRWNVELLHQLNNDPKVTADFVTIHAYMYDKHGWQKDFPVQGTANLLFASDHLASRINKIFAYANSPLYPVMVTEFNVHIKKSIAASSLLSALFYVDFTLHALHNEAIVGMARWQVANWKRTGLRGESLLVTEAGKSDKSNDIWKMAPYYAARLLGKLDKRVLTSSIQNAPTFRPQNLSGKWRAAGDSRPWWNAKSLPMVTSVATLSSDGQALSLLILNKSTQRNFTIDVSLTGFQPDTRYRKTVLNSINPGGHSELFKINPWRLSRKGKCMPKQGGCSRSLASEAGENIALLSTTHRDADKSLSIHVAAHSATLIQLTSEEVNSHTE